MCWDTDRADETEATVRTDLLENIIRRHFRSCSATAIEKAMWLVFLVYLH